MYRLMYCLALCAAAVLAQVPDEEPKLGSISGVVRDDKGNPVAEATVRTAGRQDQTGPDGRYRLNDIQAGRRVVFAYKDFARSRRILNLAAGQALTGGDLTLNPPAEIAGRVVNDEGEPMAGVEVILVGSELYLGTLRHTARGRTMSDDQGEYHLKRVEPGISWALAAQPFVAKPPAISDAPADPEARLPVPSTTYYPLSPSAEGAQRMTLRPGEVREGVDIQMHSSPSFCIEGQANLGGKPQELHFQIEGATANFGGHSAGVTISPRPAGRTTSDGRFRICDLAAGNYRLTMRTSGDEGESFFLGVTNVAVTDGDVKDVVVGALPLIPLKGEVVWYSEPPEQAIDTRIRIRLDPLYRAKYFAEMQYSSSVRSSIPGGFEYPGLSMEQFVVRVTGLPKGIYIKDILYGGDSILDHALDLGSKRAGTLLRILLAHDGATLNVKTVDEDGEPVRSGNVFVIPDEAFTAQDVAARTVSGSVDQLGTYSLEALAPGKYKVFAATETFSRHPDMIAKLMRAGATADRIELGPGATQELTVTPIVLR